MVVMSKSFTVNILKPCLIYVKFYACSKAGDKILSPHLKCKTYSMRFIRRIPNNTGEMQCDNFTAYHSAFQRQDKSSLCNHRTNFQWQLRSLTFHTIPAE